MISLAALALFLLGTNFCVFAPPPSLAGPVAGASQATKGSKHGCCAAREQASRNAAATRQATEPCCVAVAPVLAGYGAHLDPTPVAAMLLPPVLAEAVPALPALERLALAEGERPPALHSATPAAGRAPPRL